MVAVALGLVSCGGSSGGDNSEQARIQREIRSVNDRLQSGTWRLVGYASEISLEPFLLAWLESAKANNTIRFGSGHVVVQAPPNLNFDHRYVVKEAYGDRFLLTTKSDSGAEYLITCDFVDEGRKIQFHGETSPFRGSGLLEKAP